MTSRAQYHKKMDYTEHYLEQLGVTMQVAAFTPAKGVAEWHMILTVDPRGELFSSQMNRIYAAEDAIPLMDEYKGARYVLKRYFLSDSTNQQPLMRREIDIAISAIQQQPLNGSKIAVWLYLQKGTDIKNENGVIVSTHNGYKHLWKMGMHQHKGDSAWQTESVLIEYEELLQHYNATLADNCIRTWFFVRDVDTQYAGMVKARLENFVEQGLTRKTHYISSTGIGGSPADTRAIIQMGAYSVTGFEPEQERFLYAPTHLNPTYEYGVTFERGTVMEYGDRSHIFISGTASIDNKGNVLHVGDIVKQTDRMLENVEVLLKEGYASFSDVMQIVVYLRDTADFQTVRRIFRERHPDIPTIITLAPVCRPTWLIEMECIAVCNRDNPQFRDF